jgi:hypothetical protein
VPLCLALVPEQRTLEIAGLVENLTSLLDDGGWKVGALHLMVSLCDDRAIGPTNVLSDRATQAAEIKAVHLTAHVELKHHRPRPSPRTVAVYHLSLFVHVPSLPAHLRY